jgi:hypothetical protein
MRDSSDVTQRWSQESNIRGGTIQITSKTEPFIDLIVITLHIRALMLCKKVSLASSGHPQ